MAGGRSGEERLSTLPAPGLLEANSPFPLAGTMGTSWAGETRTVSASSSPPPVHRAPVSPGTRTKTGVVVRFR